MQHMQRCALKPFQFYCLRCAIMVSRCAKVSAGTAAWSTHACRGQSSKLNFFYLAVSAAHAASDVKVHLELQPRKQLVFTSYCSLTKKYRCSNRLFQKVHAKTFNNDILNINIGFWWSVQWLLVRFKLYIQIHKSCLIQKESFPQNCASWMLFSYRSFIFVCWFYFKRWSGINKKANSEDYTHTPRMNILHFIMK